MVPKSRKRLQASSKIIVDPRIQTWIREWHHMLEFIKYTRGSSKTRLDPWIQHWIQVPKSRKRLEASSKNIVDPRIQTWIREWHHMLEFITYHMRRTMQCNLLLLCPVLAISKLNR